MVGRVLRAGLATLLLALAVLAVPPAALAQGDDYIDVQIQAVSTPVIDVTDAGQVVEITGTITNTSTIEVSWLSVDLWRLPDPIRSGSRLRDLLADPESLPLTGRLVDEALGNTHILRTTDTFGPGERAPFTVRATVAELGFTADDAAYLVGVQARGLPTDSDKRTLGRAQFALPATTGPVDSSALVVLSAPPTWLPDGSFLDDTLQSDLNGRLETLLASAERPGVHAAVDPALYEAVRRLTEPHVVAGEERPGSGVAMRWLSRVDLLAYEERLWRLPYGNPRLDTADASGELQQVLAWARRAVPEALAELPSLVVLDDGTSNSLITQLSEFHTVIVRGATGASEGPPRLIGAATQGNPYSLPPDLRLAARVAEELLAERPPLYVIDTPAAAEVDQQDGTWRRHVPATALPQEPLRGAEAPSAAAWPLVSAELDEAADAAAFVAELTDSAAPDTDLRLGPLAFSKGFADEQAAASYVEAASPPVLDTSKVTLLAAQSFVMGARTNTFPATVTNELAVPVTVRVQFQSDSPQRLRVPPTDAVTIEPGGSATVNITPEATSNGVTAVRAQVTSMSGTPLGATIPIEITATDLGRVGWIIILVSGAVVVGGTALRIRAVRGQRAKEERESGQ